MRRRMFLQTLSLAAAGSIASAPKPGNAQTQSGSGQSLPASLPGFQAAGEERFTRPMCMPEIGLPGLASARGLRR